MIIDDHFYGQPSDPTKYPKVEDSLFIERNFHPCQHPGFISGFIKLYIDCDQELFRQKNLQLAKLAKASTARRQLEKFMLWVASHAVYEFEPTHEEVKVEELPQSVFEKKEEIDMEFGGEALTS